MVSDKQLLEDLKEFADEIGRTPKQKEMRESGPWSVKTYQNHFDTWNNALRKAGLEINNEHAASEDKLLEDLKELADEIGRTPRKKDMREDGPWSGATYNNYFGSWNNALRNAGLEINNEHAASEDKLLEDLKELADEIGRTPMVKDMEEDGPWSFTPYNNHFGSWNNALRKAGFEINKKHPDSPSSEQLLEDLRNFSDEIGATTTAKDMREDGPWATSTYANYFGSWNNALEKAGFEMNREYLESDEQLLEDLKEFADEIGKTPTKRDMEEDGPWSESTYYRIFNSWNNALEKADFETNREYLESDEQLLEDLKEFADEIERTPSMVNMDKNGPWATTTYERHFGSWNNALKEAGLEPNVDYDLDATWDESVTDYHGKSYKQMREKVIKRDGSRCRACSYEEMLHVHHIKPRRLFENVDDSNTLDNLITLCPSCHKIFENEWVECDPDEFAERAKASLNK